MKKIFLLSFTFCLALLMNAQESNMMTIHFSEGGKLTYPCANIDSITFDQSEAPTYDINCACDYAIAWYQGGQSSGQGYYSVALSNGPMTSNLLPTQAPQYLIRMYLLAAPVSGYDDAFIRAGHYVQTPTSYYGPDSIWAQGTDFIECIEINEAGNPVGYQNEFSELEVDVTNNPDGTYTIVAVGTLSDDNMTTVRMEYTGDLEFENHDSSYYKTLDTNVDEDGSTYTMTGNYTKDKNNQRYGDLNLAIFNTPVTSQGYIAGEGNLFSFDLFTNFCDTLNLDNLAGTYDIAIPVAYVSTLGIPGCYAEGQMYSYAGMNIPVGACFRHYNENAKMDVCGLLKKGSATITVEGTEVTFSCSFTTEEGYSVAIADVKCDGSAIQDYTVYQSPAKAKDLRIFSAMPTNNSVTPMPTTSIKLFKVEK